MKNAYLRILYKCFEWLDIDDAPLLEASADARRRLHEGAEGGQVGRVLKRIQKPGI